MSEVLAAVQLSSTSATTTNINFTTRPEQTSLPKTTMFQRLSEWFWPQVTCDEFEYYENYPNSTNTHLSTTTTTTTTTTTKDGPMQSQASACKVCPELPDQQPQQQQENFACRSCRIRGVNCDRQRPHCSQCRDQQILCFFVTPLPRLTKKPKRAPSQQQQQQPPIAVPPLPPSSSQAIRC